MPKTEGTIPRKLLPIFIVVQELGDVRDDIYHSIINELLKKYQTINEVNADVEVCIYLLKICPDGIYATSPLSHIADFLDDDILAKTEEVGTFASAIEVLSSELSVKGFLSAEVGYYEPIIFFFVDEIEIDEVSVKRINTENKWFQCSTKIAISFSDYFDKFKGLLGAREAAFAISKDMDANRIEELVSVIYDIRINSITHSIQANFSQTGDICAAMFRGVIDEPDEYSESLYDFSKKQQQFKTLIAVDPLEESVSDDIEPIILSSAIATPEEQGDGDDPVDPDDDRTLDSDTDDWVSESWDD